MSFPGSTLPFRRLHWLQAGVRCGGRGLACNWEFAGIASERQKRFFRCRKDKMMVKTKVVGDNKIARLNRRL
jgi:hypothetical protein